MGNPLVRADAGRFPHRMAAGIACAIRSARFRGEGGPSPTALRAASAEERLSPPPAELRSETLAVGRFRSGPRGRPTGNGHGRVAPCPPPPLTTRRTNPATAPGDLVAHRLRRAPGEPRLRHPEPVVGPGDPPQLGPDGRGQRAELFRRREGIPVPAHEEERRSDPRQVFGPLRRNRGLPGRLQRVGEQHRSEHPAPQLRGRVGEEHRGHPPRRRSALRQGAARRSPRPPAPIARTATAGRSARFLPASAAGRLNRTTRIPRSASRSASATRLGVSRFPPAPCVSASAPGPSASCTFAVSVPPPPSGSRARRAGPLIPGGSASRAPTRPDPPPARRSGSGCPGSGSPPRPRPTRAPRSPPRLPSACALPGR